MLKYVFSILLFIIVSQPTLVFADDHEDLISGVINAISIDDNGNVEGILLMMNNGVIIDKGTPDDLIKKHGKKNLEEAIKKTANNKRMTLILALSYSSKWEIIEAVKKIAKKVGFILVDKSEINANSKDLKDHPKGVWTLPPSLRLKEQDKEKYLDIGESDRMTLLFQKP